MKKYLLTVLITCSNYCFAQLNITPMPAEVKMGKGFCTVKEPIGFILIDFEDNDNNTNDGVESFKKYLKKNYKLSKFVEGDTHSYGLPTEILFTRMGEKKTAGYYELEVTPNKIYIKGTALGKFYAFETLKQMITVNAKKEIVIPICKITDYPRFAYRGMHLDVGRHFFPVAFIKKYIDYLAAYKYNTFHWHLTEDQGWRIEIKKYPLLTQVGSCRDRTLIGRYGSNKYDSIKYCGFYTQQEVKEIVKYAADRYITVIPEIEMPGHSTAALASYPYLGCTKGPYKVMDTWGVLNDVYCAGNDSTFTFLQNVLDEVMQLFPSKYIHIGGDECPKERWKTCPLCQKRIKDENLKDEHALQSYFIQRIEKYLNSRGRLMIGWDEILEGGLAPNATVMSWRGEEGGIAAAKQDHDVIMTPGTYCYLDHSQSKNEDSVTIGGYLPLEKVYSYEPIPKELSTEQAKHILGAQGNVWTEYMGNTAKVEYMIFPRMSALSEVLWSPAKKRDWKDFERRIPVLFKRYEQWGANYSKAYYDLQATVLPTEDYNGILWKLESKNKTGKITGIQPWADNGRFTYTGPVLISPLGGTYSAGQGNSNWISQKFFMNKATGKKITLVNEPNKSYPGNSAFTLVDGVQNEKGLARSSEFLGFLGKDIDAMVDLKTLTDISKVALHVLDQNGSWIYLPSQVEITYLPDMDITDEIIKNAPKQTKTIDAIKDKGAKTIVIESKQQCRYIHIVAKNFGIIPSGNPGAGNAAWLFMDEIEVE